MTILDKKMPFFNQIPAVSDEEPKLWTTWIDYFATGEGRTICVLVGYAEDAADAKLIFEERFGEWFAKGCESEQGIKTEMLNWIFKPEVVTTFTNLAGQAGNLELYGQMHFNLS